ncbi:tRNA pseudouridine(38-40) synthase TruA [Acidovorax sp. SUPP1855]|uniref:tRNA pseudouridine(38-40) synthase TruA n=1 Tax=Acidovorax sp. SUPP1855 TaxID=431774 RepID=UPI0023DE61B5|nr:tRNA pseudouridine(38-40) synthase TruA [Acidovorax sp. SUPP1855]GKS82718.1 tRNA pseudouridine(38-40) synthase TruA [Acidovorax sp. SUPP1855]
MRMALGVSYNGQGYNGWQSQSSGRTIQDHLEAALGRFATQPVSTICAGRTDAGVHGLMQVVHFDTPLDRTPFSWVRGTNTFLPADIAVQWAHPVPETFHARFCATSRRYAYVLLQSPVRPSVDSARVGWVFHPMDGNAMREAAAHLLGEHDFTSFRASACQAKSPIKTLQRITITRRGPAESDAGPPANAPPHDWQPCYWRFEFEGNAFLHHMIRNIMGCLVAIGQGNQPAGWMQEVLLARSRDAAAPTFSPDGLYFQGPLYDAAWGLPLRTAAYDWLP